MIKKIQTNWLRIPTGLGFIDSHALDKLVQTKGDNPVYQNNNYIRFIYL